MNPEQPDDPRPTPREAAESEELEAFESSAADRDPGGAARRGDQDDPREEEGWTQPESSAQKGAARDEG